MKKFSCKGCGNCCKFFGGAGTLPLFWDEKKRFIDCANKLGIALEFRPENTCLDKKSGLVFCGNWGMKTLSTKKDSRCPFLDSKNMCKIYEKRGLICRAFPIGKIVKKSENLKLNCFMNCPNGCSKDFVHKATKVKDIEKFFREIYGEDSFLAAKEIGKRKKFIDQELKKLRDNKKIEIIDADFLDYKKIEIIDIFEFLKKFEISYN